MNDEEIERLRRKYETAHVASRDAFQAFEAALDAYTNARIKETIAHHAYTDALKKRSQV